MVSSPEEKRTFAEYPCELSGQVALWDGVALPSRRAGRGQGGL